MAQKYRKIDPRIWSDEDFVRMGHLEKLIVIYCLTSNQTNRIGIFRFSMAMAAEDLDTLPLTFQEGFGKVCQTLNWEYDSASRTLYIPNWWRYNEPDNANWMVSCLDDLHDVPRSYLLDKFKRNISFLSRKCNVPVFEERFGNVTGNLPDTLPQTLPPNPPPNLKLKLKQELKQNNTPYSPPEGDGDSLVPEEPEETQKPKKPRKQRATSDEPLPFESVDFMAAWIDWCEFRGKLKPTTITHQFRQFREWGETKSISAIRNSITNGWKGLFPPSEPPAGTFASEKAQAEQAKQDRIREAYEYNARAKAMVAEAKAEGERRKQGATQ